MRLFLRAISFIFHPLFIPMAGTLAYFLVTPKYSPIEVKSGNLLPIFILTIIIPILAYLILRNLGLVSTIFIPNLRERRYPLYIYIVLLVMVIYKVIPNSYTIELYYYFLGLIVAAMSTLILLFLKFKISMHLMGMGSLYAFLIGLSIHFKINITIAVSLLTLATGLVATSRLYLHAHNKPEVCIGFIIGLLSQLLMVPYWL